MRERMDAGRSGWEDGGMSPAAFPTDPFAGPTRIDLEPVPLAIVRHKDIRVDALTAAFDQGYSAIGGLFADGRLVPTGPAIAVYFGDPMGTFDLELGFPVLRPLTEPIVAGGVTVQASTLPSGPAYAATYVGPYDGLGSAWQALAAAVDAEPAGVWIESYVSDPSDTAAAQLRTDLIMPVRE